MTDQMISIAADAQVRLVSGLYIVRNQSNPMFGFELIIPYGQGFCTIHSWPYHIDQHEDTLNYTVLLTEEEALNIMKIRTKDAILSQVLQILKISSGE